MNKVDIGQKVWKKPLSDRPSIVRFSDLTREPVREGRLYFLSTVVPLYQQTDIFSVPFDEPVFFHVFQLPRHGAAVYAQIVGQGGHTVRQLKIICADNCGELVKIIDQFFADRSLAENIHSRAQRARFFGHELQQIRNQRGMAAARRFRTASECVRWG